MRISGATDQAGNRLDFADFNVIVGGNAVGKTTLLLEIHALATNASRQRWFWIDHNKPLDLESSSPLEDLRLLRDSLARKWDGGNLFYFSKATRTPEGNVDQDGSLRFVSGDLTTLDQALSEENDASARVILLSGFKYWRPFVSFESCEKRLSLTGELPVTSLDQPPENALNVLYRDRTLHGEIDDLIFKQFGSHLALLPHRLTQLEFGLSKQKPPEFDSKAEKLEDEHSRIEDWKASDFTTISEVGHGIRSMVKLLMSLQDPVSHVMLIDEPEMHIYPAQKRWLGRELVRLAREQSKQVFMVTHDPIVLQGILDTEGNTRVFRLAFDEENVERVMHVCELNRVSVGAKRNQDSYLQTLFYQRTIAVEGAADRAFYQVMCEELLGERIGDKDLGFVSCGGVGQSKNFAHLASEVGLASAFIYDFDALISGLNVLLDIMKIRQQEAPKAELLKKLFQDKGLTDKDLGVEGRKGPGSQLVTDNQQLFDDARAELKAAGIHIVPYVTLESWAEGVEPRARFPELAPDMILADNALADRLKEFLDGVLRSVNC